METNRQDTNRQIAPQIVGSFVPLASGGLLFFLLDQLSSESGAAWAQGLFESPEHWLYFGGNPAEAYSHLLDWIVFSGGCLLLLATWVAMVGFRLGPYSFPSLLFLFVYITLLIFAVVLDGRHGEGTLLPSLVLIFLPTLALMGWQLARHRCYPQEIWRALVFGTCILLLSLSGQWLFEHSETGGPNLLAFLVCPILLFATNLGLRFIPASCKEAPGRDL